MDNRLGEVPGSDHTVGLLVSAYSCANKALENPFDFPTINIFLLSENSF